jgi:hypothetical protein
MKLSYKQKYEKLALYMRHRQNTLSFFGVNQYIDWKILIVLASIVLGIIFLVAGGLYIFVITEKDAFDLAPESSVRNPLNEKHVQEVIDTYEARSKRFLELKEAPYGYIEPDA